ncbi:MAG: pyridoxal phosphate-dependent aminotransferase [Oscillospiraceae bacterium]
MKRYEHGGNHSHDIIYDLSVNINPLGMPEGVRRALAENIDKFSAYPDPECRRLTEKLSEAENISAENIVCGNGAADLIYRLVQEEKPKRALLISPTFSEYEKALSETGCEIAFHELREEDGFSLTERILDDMSDDMDMLFLCSPNNPTGAVIKPPLMDRIYDECRRKDILLVIDECFMGFVCGGAGYSFKPRTGAIVLKAFTKLYAMAGLRLGYVLCGDISLAQRLRETGQCWSVSVPAQLAGEAALAEKAYASETVRIIRREREYLIRSLENMGFGVYPSEANFILFQSPLPLDRLLLREGIAVRSCANFRGLDGTYFRTAVRTHEENAALICAIGNITAASQKE